MLNFVFGRSGCGKTEYCFSQIHKLVSVYNCDNVLLITPEQYNFTAEKKLLSMLGESRINYVGNLSFSRLFNEISRLYGGNTLPVLTKGAKAVLMKKAINSVKDRLSVFQRKTEHASFISSMIDIYDEMKSCCVTSSDMHRVSEKLGRDMLADKLCDMSLVLEAYEELISGRYFDSADELHFLYNKLAETDYLKGKIIFIDGFNGFIASEFKLLELIISRADEVYITLATDSYGSQNKYELFSYVNKTANMLSELAERNRVKVSVINLNKEKYRTSDKYLRLCERELFSENAISCEDVPDSVSIYSAKSVADECSYISLQIKKNLMKGVRAKEIAVICRDLNKYSSELVYAFRKYEIPYFDDERQQIKMQPLIVFTQYLIRSVLYSYRSEDILSLAKTGLTDIDPQSVSALDNYIFMWSISGVRKWNSAFEGSVKGFNADNSDSDIKMLAEINSSREYLVSRLNRFKSSIKDADATAVCEEIYNALIDFNVNKNLKGLALSLSDSGRGALAQEQERVWDLLMEILNSLAVILQGSKISLAEFYELFTLMVSFEDLGVLPQGIDNVQIGQADRIRADNPKVVFILGANEGEFPRAVSSGGLLSERDRIILSENEFNLYSFGETLNYQERYFAYMAVSAAGQRLYVTYEGSDKSSSPSIIVTSLNELFPKLSVLNYGDINELDLIGSRASAFELMAERFKDNTVFSETLKEYFKDDSRFDSVRLLAENENIVLKNRSNAISLFGKDMFLSASRVEDYFSCRFKYFCKFGLVAKPLESAQLNAMKTGTIIHYVLERIIGEIGSCALSEKSAAELRALVYKFLTEYFESEMGSTAELSERFKYQFMRLSGMLVSVVSRLAEEFSQSEFEAKAFELNIDKDGAVKPLVINLEEGTVQLRGSVDRVDVLDKNGIRYVRVVDYKTGTKKFRLSDILYGLNLQMFVYLFSICSDKTSEFSGVPAGVLYMHAARSVFSLERDKLNESLDSKMNSEFKVKGIVLYDDEHDILRSMEKDLKSRYIPVKYSKSKGITGSFASLESLGIISGKINSLIAEMGNNLHKGLINQNPINGTNHDKTCEFCEYSTVCANRRIITNREMEEMSDADVIDILKG